MKKSLLAILLGVTLFISNCIPVMAEPADETEDVQESEGSSISDRVDTNMIPNWPVGPDLNAKAAILIDADKGVILYSKNIHERLYPASTTKMMTALLAAENCDFDETVRFSHDAVFSLEKGSSNIGIDPGQSMPLRECLYGIMVASANEVANAVAEHVSGDIDSFVDLMNQKAEELGLEDTHYANTNGLFNEDHYTSAYDLAMVANAFFKNDHLSRIGNTPSYHFEATDTQPDDFFVKNKHKLINGDIPYEGIKGGKTGYTEQSGETLVTMAEQNGMKLICVIMDEESPDQFNDTVKLFDYGFGSFMSVNIADNEITYSVSNSRSFSTNIDVLGNSEKVIRLREKDSIIMPRNINFDDIDTTISYDDIGEDEIAKIIYEYHGAYLGTGYIELVDDDKDQVIDNNGVLALDEKKEEIKEKNTVFINVVYVVYCILGFGAVVIIISFIHSVIVNYNLFENIKRRRTTRRRRRKGGGLTF